LYCETTRRRRVPKIAREYATIGSWVAGMGVLVVKKKYHHPVYYW
jgi:hypothetical protein